MLSNFFCYIALNVGRSVCENIVGDSLANAPFEFSPAGDLNLILSPTRVSLLGAGINLLFQCAPFGNATEITTAI